MQKTVGQNQQEMRALALQAMREHYKAADIAAKLKELPKAAEHLEAAERWRVRARSHGARV